MRRRSTSYNGAVLLIISPQCNGAIFCPPALSAVGTFSTSEGFTPTSGFTRLILACIAFSCLAENHLGSDGCNYS